jgi:hypothetical protein
MPASQEYSTRETDRSPTPRSVRMMRGALGSASSLRRNRSVALTPILQHGFERNQGVPRAGNSHHPQGTGLTLEGPRSARDLTEASRFPNQVE